MLFSEQDEAYAAEVRDQIAQAVDWPKANTSNRQSAVVHMLMLHVIGSYNRAAGIDATLEEMTDCHKRIEKTLISWGREVQEARKEGV